MGNSKSNHTILKSSELNEFHNMTLFSNDVLIKLHDYYRLFSSVQTDDGLIDFDEFCILIKKDERNLSKRIFNAIDVNLDGSINFREFIKFISVFINGTLEEQISLSYKIFSSPETKNIEVDTMITLIKDVVVSEESLAQFLSDDLIELIVKETFLKLVGQDNKPINYEKFKEMVKNCPDLLSWMKVDLDKIRNVKFVTKNKKTGCFG